MREWAAQAGLTRSQSARERFRKTAPGELSGLVYATAVDPGRLAAATTTTNSSLCSGERAARRVLAALGKPAAPASRRS